MSAPSASEPVGIGLGANMGDRLRNLREAVDRLEATCGPVVAASGVYETEPVDCDPDAPAFLNAVVEISTRLAPRTLLGRLHGIEQDLGRPARRPRNAPRTLDLDLLYFGNRTLHAPDLLIPHPRLHMRRFVLEPLAEFRPDLILPGRNQTIAVLLDRCADPTRPVRIGTLCAPRP